MEKKKKSKVRQPTQPNIRRNENRTKEPPVSKPGKSLSLPSSIVVVFILVSGLLSSAIVHFSHLDHWQSKKKLYYYDDNLPLMTTLDAYYYLRLAADHARGKYDEADELRPNSRRPRPVPLLVSMTSLIHRLTGVPLERIAFFLPPLLGSLMAFIYLLWGYALGGPLTALIASLAGASSYYWYTRTCLGRFDTDCLNPFFVFLMAFTVCRFVVDVSPRRYLYLVISLVLAFLFGLWWPQTNALGYALIFFSYGLSFFLPSHRAEKYLKICILASGVLLLFAVLLGLHHYLPNRLERTLESGAALFRMIVKETRSAFPNVSQSISELEAPSLAEVILKVGGHIVPFFLALAGLAFAAWKRKDAAVFLSSGLALGLCSAASRRFLIFLVPLYALGLGYLLGEVIHKSRYFGKLPHPIVKHAAVFSLLILLVAPGFYASMTQHKLPPFTASQVTLARSIAGSPSPGQVWAWWDYGYFLQYITGHGTFIDGGMQSPQRTFISAFPMSCSNAVLAGNWMRFFAVHDLAGLNELRTYLGDLDTALSFLKEILARPDESDSILAEYGFEDFPYWKQFLFPESEPLLYLSQDVMNKSYWWYYFGTWDVEQSKGVHPEISRIRITDGELFEKEGLLTVGDNLVRVHKLVSVDSSGGSIKEIGSERSLFEKERVAVMLTGASIGYVMDEGIFRSLACSLLFVAPFDTAGFDPLLFRPALGGVWRAKMD